MRTLILAAFLGAFAIAASAADVTGKWVAQVPGRQGQTMEQTFNLKQDGAKLTGTISSPRGDQEISEGKVDGDNISFVMALNFNGNSFKINYKGKVSGDEIKFSRSFEGGPDRPPVEFTAKKAN